MRRLLALWAAASLLACTGGSDDDDAPLDDDDTPDDDGPPDLLVVVLDTTTTLAIEAAMPDAAAFLEGSARWTRAVSASNTTVDSVGAIFQGRFAITTDLVPGDENTAEVALATKLRDAGWSTLLVSANSALDLDVFARGFDEYEVAGRDEQGPEADRRAVDTFIESWEAMPRPRFGWLQLLTGHDYSGRNGAPWPPSGDEELARAWGWYTDDAAETDAMLPEVFALVDEDRDLLAVTSDHGELFADRGPYMVGHPESFGHGEANSPLEIEVPLGLRGRGVSPGLRGSVASTMDLHPTLLAAAGLPSGGDLRTGVGLRAAGSSLCNLLNAKTTEGAGNMSVWVEPDGSQLVRTHSPDLLDEAMRPPLLVRWPATGIGYQRNWEELSLVDLTQDQTTFLFDRALPECKGFRDLCEDYPELEAIGYIVCD